MRQNAYIPTAVRNAVSKRDRGICHHCGLRALRAEMSTRGVLRFFDAEGRTFHIDHIKRVADGGTSTLDNLALSCAPCNLARPRSRSANDPEITSILAEFG